MRRPAFALVDISEAQIQVQHIAEGHLYNFSFVEDVDGEIQLSNAPIDVVEVADASDGASTFLDAARSFAENEARAHGRMA
jgi:hypothetical protein